MARKSSKTQDKSAANLGFEAKLWLAADKLRNNMDAAEYKHVVLGLIFLKYISDSFEKHRAKLLAGDSDYDGANPEDPDEYRAENIFWVPTEARWAHLQANAKQPTIGKIVDDAMVAIERDKIELNRRMNATLEAMARALLQSWFVDFDPVRRNMDTTENTGLTRRREERGEQPSEASDLRASVFPRDPSDSLFPAAFQDSNLGEIPKGWVVESVGDIVACVGGGTPSTSEPKYWEGGIHPWTTPKDFSALQAPVLLSTDRKLTDAGIAKISSGLLPLGTLLLSSRTPVGYLAIAAMPVAINQGFIAMKCNERASNFFMLNWCQTNMAEIESRATGTTFAEISKQNFRPIPVVLPPQKLMTAFTATVTPLHAQITANLHQSRTLATLRNTLLPHLLSGETQSQIKPHNAPKS